MLRSVFAKTLREQRRALTWWAIGLVGVCLLTTAFYPSVKDNAASLSGVIDSLPVGLRRALLGASGDLFSPEGYLQARLFSLFAPLLLMIYAIGAGSRAIAGEEEHKTLDVLLSTPVRRRRVLLDKALAMLLATAGLGLVLWIALAVSGPPFEVSVGVANLAAAVAGCVLLAWAFGSIALAVGAATGRRALATGVASGAAAASYLIDVLALSIGGLGWLQHLSLFFYYRSPDPVARGLDAVDAIVLLLVTGAALLAASIGFERRDLST
jgi:ABC-2 type transport system permease protein